MFGKKKNIPSIDSEQLELIQNAQQRVKQKKTLIPSFCYFLDWLCFFDISKYSYWNW